MMLQAEFDAAKCCEEMTVKLLMNSGEIYFKYIASQLCSYAAIAIYYTESMEDM